MSLRGQFVCFCGTADIALHPDQLNFKDLGGRVTNAGGTVSTDLTSGVTLVIACHATKKAVGKDPRIGQAIYQGTPVVTIDWFLSAFPTDSTTTAATTDIATTNTTLPVYLPISHRSAVCLINTAITILNASGRLIPSGHGATHIGALLRKVSKLAVVAQAGSTPANRVPPSSLTYAQTAQQLYHEGLSNNNNNAPSASVSPCSSRSSSVSNSPAAVAPRSHLTVDQSIDVLQMFMKGRSHPSFRSSCPLTSEYRVGPLFGTTICTAGLPKELYEVSVLQIAMGSGVFSGRLDLAVDFLFIHALRTDSASNAKSVVVEKSAKVEYATSKSIPICDITGLGLSSPIDSLQYDPPLMANGHHVMTTTMVMFREAVLQYDVNALHQRYNPTSSDSNINNNGSNIVTVKAETEEAQMGGDSEAVVDTSTVIVVVPADLIKVEIAEEGEEEEGISALVTQVAASRTLSTQGASTDLIPKTKEGGDNVGDAEEEEEGPIPTFDTYKAKARAAFDSFNNNQPPLLQPNTPSLSGGGMSKTTTVTKEIPPPISGNEEEGSGSSSNATPWKSIFDRHRERIEHDNKSSSLPPHSSPPRPAASRAPSEGPYRVTSNSNSLQPVALGFHDEGSNSEKMAAPADIVAAPPPHVSPFNVVIQTPEMRPMAYSELLPEMAALLDDASASLYIDDADDKLRESSTTTTTNPYSVVPPSPAPRRITTPAQSPRKTLRNSESRAPSRSRHLNIGGLSIRPPQSLRPQRDPSLLAIAPPPPPAPQQPELSETTAITTRPTYHVPLPKDKTTMWLIGCTTQDTSQIRVCCLRCGFVRVPLLHVSLVSYIVVGSRLTRSEEAMLKQWSDINEFPHVRIVTLKWLGMYSRLLESPPDRLSSSEIAEALQSLQFTFRRSHVLAAAETPTKLAEQQAAAPVVLADMSDRLSLLQMGAVYDQRRKKRAGNRTEDASDAAPPLTTLPALPSTPQRSSLRAPSTAATPRAAAAAGGRSMLPPPSPGGVFLGTHIPTSVGPVVGVTTLVDFERIAHSLIKSICGLLPPIPHPSLAPRVNRPADREVFRPCRVKVGLQSIANIKEGAAEMEDDQPPAAIINTIPNVLSVRINPPGHAPLPTTTRLQFQLFAYHEDTFSKAHSATAKALLKFGGVANDEDVIRIPKSGPTLSHLVSTHVRTLLRALIDSPLGDGEDDNNDGGSIKALSATSYTPKGLTIISPDNRKAIKKIITAHEALMDVEVDVFVRVLSPHHNETSGIQLRPTPVDKEPKELSIQVPYTLSSHPGGTTATAEGGDNIMVVGTKRERGADIVVTVNSSMTVQHVTLAYLATQLCFEQQRLYHSAAKELLLESATSPHGEEDDPLGLDVPPLCCELSDSWSLEVWSPVLRALCTMPILRRGSIRAGGTHKLRESAYVTTKRHIKPNASGVCIFILVTGCVPEKAALRNLVVYFIESAIGLLGGTVVGSVELPSTEDTIMPVDTTTHVLLLDLDRCTISGDDNNQEGNKPSRSIPEDLLPPVLLPEYTNSSLEFVDAASWLASSVEAGYFVDEGQREEFTFTVGSTTTIATCEDTHHQDAETQEDEAEAPHEVSPPAHRHTSLPPPPCTPPRTKFLTPPPCTPPPISVMAAEEGDYDADLLLSDIIEATIRKTTAHHKSMEAASPPPSSATPVKHAVGFPTSAPGTPQSKSFHRPPTTLTLVAEEMQSRAKTATPPPSSSCTPSRQFPNQPSSDKSRYIYIVGSVRNVSHLRSEMRKLCSIHRAGLKFHQQGLTLTTTTSSPTPSGGVSEGHDAYTYYVTDDVFYADLIVTDQVSKRESILTGIAGGAMLVTEGFVSACLLDRTIQDPTQYLWTLELQLKDIAARNLSSKDATNNYKLLRGHLRGMDEPIFAQFHAAVIVFEDGGCGNNATAANIDHAKALGFILGRGGCQRAMLAGVHINPETNTIMCTSLHACRAPCAAPAGKAELTGCFDPSWPSIVSQLWDRVSPSASPSLDGTSSHNNGTVGGTPLPPILREIADIVGEEVLCITNDPIWKHILNTTGGNTTTAATSGDVSPSSPPPSTPTTFFGPNVRTARTNILVETLTSRTTSSASASPTCATAPSPRQY